QPRRATSSTVAKPIPELAPVTRTVCELGSVMPSRADTAGDVGGPLHALHCSLRIAGVHVGEVGGPAPLARQRGGNSTQTTQDQQLLHVISLPPPPGDGTLRAAST